MPRVAARSSEHNHAKNSPVQDACFTSMEAKRAAAKISGMDPSEFKARPGDGDPEFGDLVWLLAR